MHLQKGRKMRQGTHEWFTARCGKATASRFKDIMAMTRSGPSTSRKRYMIELITERLTGCPVESPLTRDMLWGIEHEGMAREALEVELGMIIDEVGFFGHPELDCGASPDGVTDKYTVEIKCPKTTTHVETMLNGMPAKHKAQVHGQMWLAGKDESIFCSFDPRMPKGMKLFYQIIKADGDYIDKMEQEMENFLDEVKEVTTGIEISKTNFRG